MSGHSKFHNIKKTKDKADAIRGKIFTKIGREIAVAVKIGGADPSSNNRLFDIIAKAKANNMPNENISRSIKKASGELSAVNYEEITYEAYGPSGVAFIVECLTDNRNRTAGDVRHLFDQAGGSLGTSGSVSFMFDKKGVIAIEKGSLDEDKVFEVAIEGGADDVQSDEDTFIIYCQPQSLNSVKSAFITEKIDILQADIELIPSTYIVPEDKHIDALQKLIDALENLDDVQNIYHNGDFE